MGEESVSGVVKKGKKAYRVLAAHRYTTIAGMLTFFLIMSFVPFLFWLLLLLGRAGIRAEDILEFELFGWAKDFLLLVIRQAEEAEGSGVGIVFLLTTLWSGSAFFYHLRKSGEILYDFKRVSGGWKVRISAILLTLAVLIFFVAAIGIILSSAVFAKRFPPVFFYLTVYSVITLTGIFAAWILNSYILPYHTKPTDTLPGSLLTAAAWLVASTVFLVYYKFSNKEKLYGAMSLLVVFLLWLYWMMICFTAGAVFNRYRMRKRALKKKDF